MSFLQRAEVLMTMKTKTVARKSRKEKYFDLEEGDNAWWVKKGRNGYYLYNGESGRVEDCPSKTIGEALYDAGQFSGGCVQIKTNINLEELFAILNTNPFEPLLQNTESLTINDVEIDIDSFKSVLIWYRKLCEKLNQRS
jgi:hypothetical protein